MIGPAPEWYIEMVGSIYDKDKYPYGRLPESASEQAKHLFEAGCTTDIKAVEQQKKNPDAKYLRYTWQGKIIDTRTGEEAKITTSRVIICGSRNFADKERCFRYLDFHLKYRPYVEIVSGHAKGADSFGEEYAKEHNLKLTVFPADWKKYGRAAGPIRNREMLQYASEESPVIIAFWDGKSAGTKNMIEQGRKAGAEVYIDRIDGPI